MLKIRSWNKLIPWMGFSMTFIRISVTKKIFYKFNIGKYSSNEMNWAKQFSSLLGLQIENWVLDDFKSLSKILQHGLKHIKMQNKVKKIQLCYTLSKHQSKNATSELLKKASPVNSTERLDNMMVNQNKFRSFIPIFG